MSRFQWRRSLELAQACMLRNSSKLQPKFQNEFLGENSFTGAPFALTTHAYHSFAKTEAFSCLGPCGYGKYRQSLGQEACLASPYRSYKARGFHSTGVQSMPKRDFYEVLGVEREASQAEIKKAYYALAKVHHPDVNKGNEQAEDKFQEIQHAYEVLKDEKKREAYNQMGPEAFDEAYYGGGAPPGGEGGFPNMGGFGFQDINEVFGSFFGGQERRSASATLELSFQEAAHGCTKTVSYPTRVQCKSCGGSGVPPGVKPQLCRDCSGSGREVMKQGWFTFETPCRTCGGSGQYVKAKCSTCIGEGTVKGTKQVEVVVPPGVDNGLSIKIPGERDRSASGGRAPDLLVHFQVKEDPVFKREGPNIHVDTSIGIATAILGGQVQVPTMSGDVILKVRAGTQPGQKLVLRGKGIKRLNSKHYGDQYVHFIVAIPTNLSDEQRRLIEEFAREENAEIEKVDNAAEGSG